MPIIASARKKMRQDKKRRITNLKTLAELKKALKKAQKKPSAENIKLAISIIDQAAKKKVIHGNKAARLKSRLSKKVVVEEPKKKPIKKRIKGKA